MSKQMYYTVEEIKGLIDNKIDETGKAIIRDKSLTQEDILGFVNEIRIFEKYAYEMVEELIGADGE